MAEQSGEKRIIYVDIDGTLTEETEGWGNKVYLNRTPKPNVIASINKMYEAGDLVILWSSRFAEDRDCTIKWLKANEVKYHRLILEKPSFDLYICDRVLNVEDL